MLMFIIKKLLNKINNKDSNNSNKDSKDSNNINKDTNNDNNKCNNNDDVSSDDENIIYLLKTFSSYNVDVSDIIK